MIEDCQHCGKPKVAGWITTSAACQCPDFYEVSASTIGEAQTRKIMREFKRSMPRPRNRAMGFKKPWLDKEEPKL